MGKIGRPRKFKSGVTISVTLEARILVALDALRRRMASRVTGQVSRGDVISSLVEKAK